MHTSYVSLPVRYALNFGKQTAPLYFCSSSFDTYTIISSQSHNLGGRRGTTDDVATIPFHPSLSSAAFRESPNPIPVHSLMLSSHLFCLPLLLAPFTVPCRIIFAMLVGLEMWPYHLSFRFFTVVRRSSCTPISQGAKNLKIRSAQVTCQKRFECKNRKN